MTERNKTAYIAEILSQPAVLAQVIPEYDFSSLLVLRDALVSGRIRKVILTGMGASLYAAYSAWLILAQHGITAMVVDAAELLHFTPQLITPDTLVWVVSQSGRSAELLPLLEIIAQRKAHLLATTNDPTSPLAQSADVALCIQSPVERTVSTVTYTTTLANLQLAALTLCGQPFEVAKDDLFWTVEQIRVYLQAWEKQVVWMTELVKLPSKLALIGRGPSLSAVMCGALIQSEAAKVPVVGMNAAEFRHGPLELGGPDLTVLVMAGVEKTRALSVRLAEELYGYASHVLWVGVQPQGNLPWLALPAWRGLGLALAEIIPLQLLTIVLANQKGLEAGKFFYSGKITQVE